MKMDNKIVYSTDSYEHSCNLLGIEPFEEEYIEIKDVIYDEKLCKCGIFEVYSETLSEGLCLNCYHDLQEDRRLMEIECRNDYEEGLI